MSEAESAASVSAVVRVGRLGHGLLETLDALARPGCRVREVVLLADAGADAREQAALRALAAREGRHLVLGGEAPAWSSLAGDAVLLLDAGHALAPGLLEAGASALAADPSLGVLVPALRREWPSGRDERVAWEALDAAALLADPWGAPRAALCSRDALLAAGALEPSLHPFERVDLFLRALARGHRAEALAGPPLLERPRPPADDAFGERASARLEALVERHAGALAAAAADALVGSQRRLQGAGEAHRHAVARRDAAEAELGRLDAEVAGLRAEQARRGRPGVDWGELRRRAPVSRAWGEDRGRPLDRFYLDAFLAAHREDLRGAVLEVQEPDLTERWGGGAIERVDVVDVEAANPRATLLADLRDMRHVPDASYDAFVLTQTLHVIEDVPAVLREARRILRPGGVLLASFPAASRVCVEYGREGDFWRATEAGVRALFRGAFDERELSLSRYGNLLTTVAFLEGLAAHELEPAEFAPFDPWYPLLFGVRAVKTDTAERRFALELREPSRGAILLYHRVAEGALDPHGLALPPAAFAEQMRALARDWHPLPLDELARRARDGTLPEGAVAVTFDDAYEDALAEASPALLACSVPATFFAVARAAERAQPFWWDLLAVALLGPGERPPSLAVSLDGAERRFATDTPAARRSAHDLLHGRLVALGAAPRDAAVAAIAAWAGLGPSELPRPLAAAGLRELAARPGHALGAHGLDHVALVRQDDAAQRREIVDGRRALEALLGAPVQAFAYPYGDVCASVARRVREAGFLAAVSCDEGGVGPRTDPWRLPRLEVRPGEAARFAERLRAVAAPRRPA